MAVLNGTSGDDIFTGGSDPDTLVGNGGNDTLSGAGSNDILVGNAGADTLNGGDGDDILFSADQDGSFGYPYSNIGVLDTVAEADTLLGGAGEDRLIAGYGDVVDGGDNTDTVYMSFLGASAGVNADFRQAVLVIGGGTIQNIENIGFVQGSNFNDHINLQGPLANGYSPFAQVYGMDGNDELVAGYYTGRMYGGAGNDIVDGRPSQYMSELHGDAGDDTIYTQTNSFTAAYGEDGNDTIYSHGTTSGGAGNDLIFLQDTYYTGRVNGDDGDDVIHAAAFTSGFIIGGAGADILMGGGGNDSLFSFDAVPFSNTAIDDVGPEHDQLSGGDGADNLAIGYGDDADGGQGTDSLRLSLAGYGAGIIFSTAGIAAQTPVVLGGGTIQNIESLVYLRGTDFADTLTIATQSVMLTLEAGDGDDVITTASSSVTVNGGAGADRLVSGAAGDIFDGGLGADTIDYSNYGSGVTVNLAAGVGGGGDQLTSVENITGSGFDDTLVGTSGANMFNGGAGSDTVSYALASSGVAVNLTVATAQTTGWGSDTLTSIESLIGSSLADILTGNSAANLLNGGAGADTLTGGDGSDTYVIDNVGDVVIELAAQGTDTVDYSGYGSAVTVNLSAGSGPGGSGLANVENIVGTSFNDTFTDTSGDNVLAGGSGSDTVSYALASLGVAVDLSVATTQNTGWGSDTLTSIESLVGSAHADTLTGNALANFLDGGGGADTLIGGAGDDTYVVDSLGDVVTELVGEGADTLQTSLGSTVDYAQLFILPNNIENLTGSSSAAQGVWANSADNVVTMGVGADLIVLEDGGADTVDGGGGNDFIYFGATLTGADHVDGGAGQDTIGLIGTTSIVFTANIVNVERLAMYSAAYFGGGAFDYTITTIDANVGAAGLFVTAASLQSSEHLIFNGSAETDGGFVVHGGAGADIIIGGARNDYIIGKAGADLLTGNAGSDILLGGTGDDQFIYLSVGDSTAVLFDRIQDFAAGDRIDLSAIDAIAGGANDAFSFIGQTAFSHTAGELRAVSLGGASWQVQADVNGDGIADLVILVGVADGQPLGAGGFVL